MSKLHKNFDHALERIDRYMHGQNSNDKKTHISNYRYKYNIRYCSEHSSHEKHFDIRVKKNIGRFEIMNIIQNQDFNTYFNEIPKIDDKFGPAYSTHLFLVKLAVPRKWVMDDPNCEIHFIWESQCEASIYCPKTGRHLQAFSENSRDVYHIKVGPQDSRNDLIDSNLVIYEDSECITVCYLVEMACQEMFGSFASWGGDVDMEKQFTFKKCEIGLFNYKMDKYYYNIEMIRDAAKLLEQDQSTRAHRYLNFIYDCANKYHMPLSDQQLESAIIESDEFIQNNKNGSNQFKIFAVGHCHIDTAWLWPYRETKRKIARSWSTQLEYINNLFKDHGFKFCASSAAHYWWLKQYYPELYARLKQAVKDGTFEIVGGTWVEFDGNIPSGESMTRQFLYGQHFFEDEFGKKPKVFFLPDTFGYSPQLPQIAKNAEIEYFLTQKISWNFWNTFPHHTFYWKGIDGSEILSHFPPADTYCGNGSVKEVLKNVQKLKDKGRTECALYLFGDGDGGGGPQLKHIERLTRVKDFDGIPKVQFSTCHEFFEVAKATQNKLMSWEGELYLELHNGTYTNMSEHKYYNRYMETMFRDMEFFYYLAEIAFQNSQKPTSSHQNIKDMWHIFLIDQFHDVLPGTCTFLTVEDTRQNFKELNEQSLRISENSIKQLLQIQGNINVNRIIRFRPQFDQLEFDPSKESVIIFNTLNYDRKDLITCKNQNERFEGYFFTPQVGLASFTKEFLQDQSQSQDNTSLEQLQNQTFVVNNKFYEAVVCRQTGQIISLKDKRTKNYQRQVVQTNEALNKLVIYDDVPFHWDNWDIMHHTYETQAKLVQNSIISFTIKEQTRERIILSYKFKISDKSSLSQDIIFYSDTSKIDFKTQVDWYESKKLLKAYFPVDIRTDYATFEIGSGTIRRNIHENTSWDQARLEVFGHKFVDLSESQYGVSILNDCKYGFTVRNQTIGISLLKAGEFPWAQTDKMSHEFVYSILCHDKPLIVSDVFEESYKLNTPLWAAIVQKQEGKIENPLNPYNFFEMIDSPNCIISAFKQSERAEKQYILRICEQRGDQCMATIKFNKNIFDFKQAKICNGLENIIENSHIDIQFEKNSQTLKVRMQAFKICSILIQ